MNKLKVFKPFIFSLTTAILWCCHVSVATASSIDAGRLVAEESLLNQQQGASILLIVAGVSLLIINASFYYCSRRVLKPDTFTCFASIYLIFMGFAINNTGFWLDYGILVIYSMLILPMVAGYVLAKKRLNLKTSSH